MRTFAEIKEKIDCLDPYDCSTGQLVDALQELTDWMEVVFCGDILEGVDIIGE